MANLPGLYYCSLMLFDKYVNTTQAVANAVDAQDYDKALQLLKGLIESDLPDLDKSVMSINVAVVWDKKGNSLEALRWYDRAVQLERPHHRYFAQQEKAKYLLGLDRKEEALSIYRGLLTKPFLVLSDQERISAFIKQNE